MSYRASRHYTRDPSWITVKYAGRCLRCKAPINKGGRAFYYPSSREMMCAADKCGGQAARDFDAARSDEEFYNGQ